MWLYPAADSGVAATGEETDAYQYSAPTSLILPYQTTRLARNKNRRDYRHKQTVCTGSFSSFFIQYLKIWREIIVVAVRIAQGVNGYRPIPGRLQRGAGGHDHPEQAGHGHLFGWKPRVFHWM